MQSKLVTHFFPELFDFKPYANVRFMIRSCVGSAFDFQTCFTSLMSRSVLKHFFSFHRDQILTMEKSEKQEIIGNILS